MGMLDWLRREQRADTYTDAILRYRQNQATGTTIADSAATAALEAASGLVARAFASADVEADEAVQAVLRPDTMALIGRGLIRFGDVLFRIETGRGRLSLLPAESWSVRGEPDPSRWDYQLTLAGPDKSVTYSDQEPGAVVHLRYAVSPGRPWEGIGPIIAASLAGKLSAETAAALADESSGPRGSFLPLPKVDGEDDTVELLKADIRKAGGSMLAVEDTANSWSTDTARAPGLSWTARRFGASPPAPLVELHEIATREVLAACGVPPALVSTAQGTVMREAWRQFLFGTIAPLGRIVSDELSAKLETEVNLSWDELRASDLQGRARAFQSMVRAGMDIAKAAALSGLMVED